MFESKLRRSQRPLIITIAWLFFIAGSATAGGLTSHHSIKWIKAYPTGMLVALDGFTLSDVDPTACADPGSPYFWIPTTSASFETFVAILLTADAGDKTVKIRYNGCSNYTPTAPMLDVWMLHVD